jgi:ketosteroid isomerase-like protein
MNERSTINVQLLERYLNAINSWDFAAMRNLLDPQISYELPWVPEPFPKMTQGLDNVMAFLESVPAFAAEENLHDFQIHAFAADPDELVAEYVSDMKLTNGREYKNSYVVRASIKDGKIVRFAEHMDTTKLIVAMGGSIIPPAD